ncbi:MAG: nitroreductase family protein [Peptoniphilaceae bacterium]|jgi:nitroreductase
MLMRNFLKTRKSVRDFKAKKLDRRAVQGINALIDGVRDKAAAYDASFTFVENGDKLYKQLEGKGGYAGVMIKAPAYIVLDVDNANADSYLYGAYYMEALITGLLDLGVASCWISLQNVGMDDKALLSEWNAQNADFMLALGYPFPESGLGEDPYSSRLGIEDIVYKEEIGQPMSLEELQQRGLDDLFYYVRFAPSQYNEQPWRYVVKSSGIDMYMKDQGRNYLVDAGIAMYYFEQLLHTMSIPGQFAKEDREDAGDFKYVGSIRV